MLFLKKFSKTKLSFSLIFIFVFGLLALHSAPSDPDFGWHYQYGQYLIRQKLFLVENIFSYTFADYFWANSYWLSQAIMYILSTIFSPSLMSLIFAGVFVYLVLKILSNVTDNKYALIISAAVLFIGISGFLITVRPLYFSSIFIFVLTYILLLKKKYIVYLPLLFLFWANMHADFVVGLGVFGFYFFVTSLTNRKLDLKVLGSLVFSILVTFINPYGYHLHLTLINEGNGTNLFYIGEFVADVTLYRLVVIALIAVIASTFWLYRSKLELWYMITFFGFMLLGLIAPYFLRQALLVGIFGFTLYLSELFKTQEMPVLSYMTKKKLEYVVVLVFALMIFSLGFSLLNALKIESWSYTSEQPYGAVQFMRQNPIEGNLINNYNWGGYLIWQYPNKQTFIDGRMPSWHEDDVSIFEDYIRIVRVPYDHEDLFLSYKEKYNITHALLHTEMPLVEYLQDKGWFEVYRDDFSVVLVEPQEL